MSMTQTLRKFLGAARRPGREGAAARARPWLEALEVRLTPATLDWVGGTLNGGIYDIRTAANWTPAQAPATGDTLRFNGSQANTGSPGLTSANLTVANVQFINGFGKQFLIDGGRTLTVTGNFKMQDTVDTDDVEVNTITGSVAQLVVSGTLTLSRGKMGNPGGTSTTVPSVLVTDADIDVAPTKTFTLDKGYYKFTGTVTHDGPGVTGGGGLAGGGTLDLKNAAWISTAAGSTWTATSASNSAWNAITNSAGTTGEFYTLGTTNINGTLSGGSTISYAVPWWNAGAATLTTVDMTVTGSNAGVLSGFASFYQTGNSSVSLTIGSSSWLFANSQGFSINGGVVNNYGLFEGNNKCVVSAGAFNNYEEIKADSPFTFYITGGAVVTAGVNSGKVTADTVELSSSGVIQVGSATTRSGALELTGNLVWLTSTASILIYDPWSTGNRTSSSHLTIDGNLTHTGTGWVVLEFDAANGPAALSSPAQNWLVLTLVGTQTGAFTVTSTQNWTLSNGQGFYSDSAALSWSVNDLILTFTSIAHHM